MKTNKKSTLSLIAMVLVLIMVLTPVVSMMPTFAYNKADKPAEGTTHQGTALPDGATVYDGTPSSELSGKGTKDEPYLIANAADFFYFHTEKAPVADSDTYFKMTGDVYLNDENYGTEGKENSFSSTPNFAGVLDGDGHTIYNFYAFSSGGKALFNSLTGVVKNLTVNGAHNVGGGEKGVFAVRIFGTLQNVHIKNVYLSGSVVGGFAARTSDGARFENCTIAGKIIGSSHAGGFVGVYDDESKSAPIRFVNCTNDATVVSSGDKASGFLACLSHTSSCSGFEFVNCVNNGAITGKNGTGGFVGITWRAKDFVNFDYCTNNGDITSTAASAGGIIGDQTSGGGALSASTYIRNCTNNGNIVAATNAGGFSGNMSLSNMHLYVTDSVNNGKVDGVSASGGIAGRNWDEYGSGSDVIVTNSANHGDIGSAGTSVSSAAIVGKFKFAGNMKIETTGFLSTGNVTATTYAGVATGIAELKENSLIIKLNNTWIKGNIVATDAAVGVVAFGASISSDKTGIKSLVMKDSGFDVSFTVGDAAVDAATVPTVRYVDATTYVGYNDGTSTVTDAAYPAADSATFATEALASLNTISATGYNEWVANDDKVAVFKVLALVVANEAALARKYSGLAVEATYTVSDSNIKSVDVKYYDRTALETPLASAPINPGDYRVLLQGKDADGADYGEAVTYDYTISKGTVSFELVYAKEYYTEMGITYESNYSSTWYKWNAPFKGSEFDIKVNIFAYTDNIKGEYLVKDMSFTKLVYNPTKENSSTSTGGASDITADGSVLKVGYYWLNFHFAGNEYYDAADRQIRFIIKKGTISYPAADAEGRWTVPTTWNGTEQSVTFNSIGGDLDPFNVVLSGDVSATDATADGVTLTATATLTQKDEWKTEFDLTGEAPVYQVQWRLAKAPTSLVLYGPDGNPVADPTAIRLEYSGETTTYVVKLLDENGNILNENVETFSLTSVTKIEKSVTVASDAVDSNHTVPDALQICLEVTPVLIEIEVGTIADKTYDGEALSAEAVTVTMTEPTGTTWNEYEKVWQKWNAETEKWETVTEVKNVGKYRLYVTRTLVVEEGVEPDCMAEGSSPAFVIEKETPTLIWNTEGFTLKGDKYVVTYDGMQKVIGATSENINLTLDNIVVEYSADGETYLPDAPILCGSYYVRVTFTGDENYEAVENFAPIQMEIEKQSFTLPESIWNYTEPYTYTGSAFTVGVARKLVENKNAYIDYKIIGETRTAQGSYKATIYIWSLQPDSVMLVAHDGSELTLEEYDGKSAYKSELSWTIQKATPDMDALDFTAPDSLVYDGADHRVTVDLSSHPYLTATYVTTCNGEVVASNAVIGAGDYVVSVTFTLNNSNYTEIPVGKETMQISFTIDKKVIDIADLVITGTEVTYNGQPHRVEIDLPDYMEQGTAVYTLNGVAVDVAEAAGEYTVTIPLTLLDTDNYEMNEDAIETTMTIAKAVYPASAYKLEDTFVLIFNDEIGADGADFIAVINAMLETLGKSLPAGNIITVANAAELPVMKTPGEATFTVRFAGSANYEAITGTKEVTLVVKPIIVTPSAENSDVTVGFPEGAPDDVEVKLEKLEPTDELKDALSANADITFNADFYGIWKFTAIDEDGSPITAEACDWTIRIQLDKDAQKAYKEGNLHVSKRAGEKLATFKNYEYNEESGVLTLRLTSKDELTATYAVAIPKNMTGLIVGIVAGVIVLAAAIGGIVALVIVRKKKRAAMFAEYENIDTDYTADDSYTGYVPEEGVEYVGTEESYGESYDGFDEEMSVDETVDESYDDTTPTDDDSDQ